MPPESGSDEDERDYMKRLVLGELPPDELPDTDRGGFTKDDRALLLGLKEFAQSQGESNAWRRIRKRIQATLENAVYLHKVPDKHRRKTIQEMDRELLKRSLSEWIKFVYLGLDREERIRELEEIVEKAVFRGENESADATYTESESYAFKEPRKGGVISVDVSIEPDWDYNVDEIEERFREQGGDMLTPAEIGVLVREGRLDTEDIAELSEGDLAPEDMLPPFPDVRDGE